jgi:hypothetical protein
MHTTRFASGLISRVSQNILGSIAILQYASALPNPAWKPRRVKIPYFFTPRELEWLVVIIQ